VPDRIRALTVIATDPSAAAAALHATLDWEIEADLGTFASLTPPSGIPLWLNAPADGEAASSGVVLHLAADDVDAAHASAIRRGARSMRTPQDMDFGERSAWVRLPELPGVILDFSHPIAPSPVGPTTTGESTGGAADASDAPDVAPVEIRLAAHGDVTAIRDFGANVLPAHYGPIIGAEAARGQVDTWWTHDAIAQSVAEGRHILAVRAGEIVGVAERGRYGEDHVLFKLYLSPEARGLGLGPRLIEATIAELPSTASRLLTEHFAGNTRAAAFYAREGFAEERVEQHPSGDRARDTVWRVRELEPTRED
jgi:GNAT superfamily N-acetyltransferase